MALAGSRGLEDMGVEDSEQVRTAAPQTLPPVHEAWLPREHSLHRPRHSKHQPTALTCALIFFCVPILLLIVGVRPEAIENRRLASFPSPADGWDFFTGLSPWATDYLPLRGDAVSIEDWVSRSLFGEPPPLGQQEQSSGPVQGPVSPPEGDRDGQESAGFPSVIEGKDGWLYLGDDVRRACQPKRSMDEVMGSLRKLRSVVEGSGRKFVLIVAPNKSTMVPEFLPDRYAGASCSREVRSEFWQRVVLEGGAIDVRSVLGPAAARVGSPLYSKSDSHWTFVGAIAMTASIAEHIEPGVTATWQVKPSTMTRRAGDLPPLIGRDDRDELRAYELAPDGQNVLSRLAARPFREPLDLNQAVTKGVVGSSVGMVADSFSLPATSYLAGGFSNLTIVHTDIVGGDPVRMGAMLASKDVVVVEAAERSLVGGVYPMLDDKVIDAIAAELAKRPLP